MSLRIATLFFVLCLVCFLWLAQVLSQWAAQQKAEDYREYIESLENLAPQCRALHPRNPEAYRECMGVISEEDR